MIDHIRNQIKKRRAEKGLTQSDVALDLGITPGAYSKIESGPTEISIKKLVAIAGVLEVDITYFFLHAADPKNVENSNPPYGFATKKDIGELMNIINKVKQELVSLKANLKTAPPKKRK